MKVATISSLFLLLISSALSEELYPCEQDAAGRFYVEGTEGNGMRYCKWAAREHTEERCQIEEVAWQCPITCQVPCIDLGDGVAIGANVVVESDSIFQSQISSSIEYDDTIPETVIVICAFIVLSAVVTFIVIKQKERQVAARSWEDDEERAYVVSDVKPVRTW
ncbi:predicted protein [Chaetoceros tenuissimus]|uniref:Uncharacterized protein n=1 Tax=Chaetoceros tenuissimus TaxID=426638 RepID=A0AAD3HAU8_9STRA|nr:predicted protein [Chaetoceros tenuissimus]